jgi:hypothetical protein
MGAEPVGAIGAYWRDRHAASAAELGPLQRLARAAAAAIDRIGVRPTERIPGDEPIPVG